MRELRRKKFGRSMLLLSLVMFLMLISGCGSAVSDSIVGSYKTSDFEGIYYVFEEDGNYCKYKQYEIIEQGMYDTDDSSKIRLDSGNVLELDQKTLHENVDGQDVVYEKFSDTPTFINVDGTE